MRGGCSTDGYKSVFGYVVPDRMDERDGSAIIYGSSIDAATLELIKEQLVEIPIPKVDTIKQNEIIKMVEEILSVKQTDSSADTSALESKIDHLVYQLYGLTDEEIKIVEES